MWFKFKAPWSKALTIDFNQPTGGVYMGILYVYDSEMNKFKGDSNFKYYETMILTGLIAENYYYINFLRYSSTYTNNGDFQIQIYGDLGTAPNE